MKFMQRERIPRHDDEPYLDRFIIFQCRWFGIFLHRFVGGDDECAHDHPWPFVVFLLKGGYTEWTPASTGEATGTGPAVGRWYEPGMILLRPANWIHRVDIGKQKTVITLVIHGPKQRSWGFYTEQGWIHWTKYSYKKHCE